MPAPSSSGRQSDDQLVRSAPLSLSSPRPFAEGVVAPSKTSTPKKRQEAAHDLQRTSRDVYRRASFLEEKSAAGSRAPLRRQSGMSVKEEEEEEQGEEGGGVTAAQRHLPNKEKGFHLSLPEIAIGDEEGEEESNNRSHRPPDHHRPRHHHHHRHRRCRTETERKISSESSCSGMDSGAGSTSSMFQRFSQLKKRADNGGQQQGNLQRSQTTTACDSGLGTPSSQSILKPASAAAAAASAAAARPAEGDEEDAEEREIQVIRFVREKEVSGDGGGTRGSKWKSSVTGK